MVGDGGLVTHFTGPEDAGTFAGLPCAQQRRWLQSMIPIEPVKYVGFAPPTSLLLQSGTTDDLVPARDAERLHAAAREPKTIRWYNAGHNLNVQAGRDGHVWLQERLGMRAPDF